MKGVGKVLQSVAFENLLINWGYQVNPETIIKFPASKPGEAPSVTFVSQFFGEATLPA
jgi:hypothetical protein